MIKKLMIFSLLIFTLLCTGCDNLFNAFTDSDDSGSTSQTQSAATSGSGSGTFTVNISATDLQRSAYPASIASSIAAWTVTATNGTEIIDFAEQSSLVYTGSLTQSVSWTITVYGYSDTAKTNLIVSGSTAITPSASVTSATVTVSTVTGGTGTIKLSVSASLLTDFSSSKTVLLLDNTSVTPSSFSYTGTTYSFTITGVTAGKHTLTIKAYNSSSALISEYKDTAVYVWTGLTTDTWYGANGTSTVTLKPVQIFYAADTSTTNTLGIAGNDTTGNGTIGSPYATITKALGRCADTGTEYKIYIAGSFTENVAISGYTIYITGLGSSKATITGVSSADKPVISSDSKLTLKNLNITGGNTGTGGKGGGVYESGTAALTITNCDIYNNQASSSGGGIYSSGPVTLDTCVIRGNKASGSGGGVYSSGTLSISASMIESNSAPNGGGIYINSGIFTMETGTSVAANTATDSGGGIYINNGTVTQNSGATIHTNTATNFGGGIYLKDGTCSIGGTIGGSSSSDANTTAGDGGGVYITGGTITLTGTISCNTAAENGGGICFASTASTDLELTAGTISKNTANSTTKGGGGIYAGSSTAALILSGVTLSGNTAANKGAGVYVSTGTFKMGGTAVVNTNNYVYLADSLFITLSSEITGTTPVATLELPSYTAGTKILYADSTDSNSYVTNAVANSKFMIAETYYISYDSTNYSGILTAYDYAVKDTGPAGGVIFYINPTSIADGWTYLEAAPADLSGTYAWDSNGRSLTGLGTAIGTGLANTELMVAESGGYEAARACSDYSLNGYSDWFWASYQELLTLKTNGGITNYTNGPYFCSSQSSSGSYAYYSYMPNGQATDDGTKTELRPVRPIRRF